MEQNFSVSVINMAASGGRTRPLRCYAIRVLSSASRSGRNRFNPDEIQTAAGIHDQNAAPSSIVAPAGSGQ